MVAPAAPAARRLSCPQLVGRDVGREWPSELRLGYCSSTGEWTLSLPTRERMVSIDKRLVRFASSFDGVWDGARESVYAPCGVYHRGREKLGVPCVEPDCTEDML